MSIAVFGEEVASGCPMPTTFAANLSAFFKPEVMQGFHVESPHLIQILQHAAPFIMRHHSALPSQEAGETSRDPGMKTKEEGARIPSDRPRLLERVKHRLQHTLLKAMMGADKEFVDALAVPLPPEPEQDEPYTFSDPKKGSPEWFEDQVWRLVGWDVLDEVF
jgi:hypothetical protein